MTGAGYTAAELKKDLESILPDDLLTQIRARAADLDQENSFFETDLADLQAAGYLKFLINQSELNRNLLLGMGLQRRLAAANPATALGINMHQVWALTANFLAAQGEDSFLALRELISKGEIIAFGISEAGNDLMLFDSFTSAKKNSSGGYSFTGVKVFTSMAPAWTRLGVHGVDRSDPENPELIFALLNRSESVESSSETWNSLGMRASQSWTTKLNSATAEAGEVLKIIPLGTRADSMLLQIYGNFELLLASVYLGIAERAFELAVAGVQKKIAVEKSKPDFVKETEAKFFESKRELARLKSKLELVKSALNWIALEFSSASSDWLSDPDLLQNGYAKLSSAKVEAISTARETVSVAIQLVGGAAYSNENELSRLYRDVLAGEFQPTSKSSLLAQYQRIIFPEQSKS